MKQHKAMIVALIVICITAVVADVYKRQAQPSRVIGSA